MLELYLAIASWTCAIGGIGGIVIALADKEPISDALAAGLGGVFGGAFVAVVITFWVLVFMALGRLSGI